MFGYKGKTDSAKEIEIAEKLLTQKINIGIIAASTGLTEEEISQHP